MRGEKGSRSSSVACSLGNVDESGVGTGEDIDNPLRPFFLGDRKEEISEDVRDWVLSVRDKSRSILAGRAERVDCDLSVLESSMSTCSGLDFAILNFERALLRCEASAAGGGPVGLSDAIIRGGIGAAFKIIPLAFASSCSITWAYKSSRLRARRSRSASTTRRSTK